MDDLLSDIFRRLELKSCVYFSRDFWSPWAMEIDVTGIAQFHVVTRGTCVLEFNGQVYEAVTGDVFLLPRGGGHILADKPNRNARPGGEVMQSFQSDTPLFATGEVATQLICGHFEYRNELKHPITEQLPPVIHIRAFENAAPGTISSILPMLVREMNTPQPGMTTVVERLAEVLLVQVLRSYLREQKHPTGFLAALTDPRLTKAIKTMHERIDDDLSLDELAQVAGMSRSSFAAQFKSVTGISPGGYLTQWRMFHACELLRVEKLPVVEVAVRVGYESEISFSRAFKRSLEITPAEYRRAH